MRKDLFLSIMTIALVGSAIHAAPVDPDRALDIARDFAGNATSRQIMRKSKAASPRMTLAYTHKDSATDIDAFYVYNRGTSDGYVMVSGDDRAPLILGYSDKGTFDVKGIPNSMRGMIESWSEQIAWLASHPDYKAAAPAQVQQPVEPLLGAIQWDQGDPYNRKCPSVQQYDQWGDEKGRGPAAVGCVATALGQILYYHKWPEYGTGSVSYTSNGDEKF